MDRADEKLLTKVRYFVEEQLKNRLSEKMYFHNLEHTLLVVEGVKVIGLNTGISDEDLALLILAAFMHDLGYTEKYMQHEEVSARIASEFLIKADFSPERIEVVKCCILATRFPQYPLNYLERIICDADFYHFSLHNYWDYAYRLKAEWEQNLGLVYSDMEWDKLNLEMLQTHEYFTTYGQQVLQEKKMHNIAMLKRRVN